MGFGNSRMALSRSGSGVGSELVSPTMYPPNNTDCFAKTIVNSDLIFVSRLEETLDEDDVFFPAGGKNISSKTRRQFRKSSKMLARRRS